MLDLLFRKSQLQKKSVQQYLAQQDAQFYQDAESIVDVFMTYLESQGLTAEDWVDAYLEMYGLHTREQVRFGKTGTYQDRTFESCYDTVYSNERQMQMILSGLALSQLLWENHYRIYRFFGECLAAERPRTYSEIGAGHGLFLLQALRRNPSMHARVIDVSPKAIEICRRIVSTALPAGTTIEYTNADVLTSDFSTQPSEFILMGEVIEHVNNPQDLLRMLKSMLASNGKAFVTTCCNCPSIDHVYLFKNVDEIRELLDRSGLNIEKELVLPNNMSWVINGEHRQGINYAALLS
jgi:2-polyprenyl-3-methyl-5-hydroxy-6-metoxy-1,4-benzoquinol methylase